MTRTALLALLLIPLTACGRTDNDPGVGGVTMGEAQELNEAAATLDARTVEAERLENEGER